MKADIQALGPRIVQSVPIDAYAENVTETFALTGSGPRTISLVLSLYFTKHSVSFPHCHSGRSAALALGAGMGVGFGSELFPFIGTASDAHPSRKMRLTGVQLPKGRMPLFMSVNYRNVAGTAASVPQGFGWSIEYGHFRPISSDDPIFSIPADFTKAP